MTIINDILYVSIMITMATSIGLLLSHNSNIVDNIGDFLLSFNCFVHEIRCSRWSWLLDNPLLVYGLGQID